MNNVIQFPRELTLQQICIPNPAILHARLIYKDGYYFVWENINGDYRYPFITDGVQVKLPGREDYL
jgi:hypothetical protein